MEHIVAPATESEKPVSLAPYEDVLAYGSPAFRDQMVNAAEKNPQEIYNFMMLLKDPSFRRALKEHGAMSALLENLSFGGIADDKPEVKLLLQKLKVYVANTFRHELATTGQEPAHVGALLRTANVPTLETADLFSVNEQLGLTDKPDLSMNEAALNAAEVLFEKLKAQETVTLEQLKTLMIYVADAIGVLVLLNFRNNLDEEAFKRAGGIFGRIDSLYLEVLSEGIFEKINIEDDSEQARAFENWIKERAYALKAICGGHLSEGVLAQFEEVDNEFRGLTEDFKDVYENTEYQPLEFNISVFSPSLRDRLLKIPAVSKTGEGEEEKLVVAEADETALDLIIEECDDAQARLDAYNLKQTKGIKENDNYFKTIAEQITKMHEVLGMPMADFEAQDLTLNPREGLAMFTQMASEVDQHVQADIAEMQAKLGGIDFDLHHPAHWAYAVRRYRKEAMGVDLEAYDEYLQIEPVLDHMAEVMQDISGLEVSLENIGTINGKMKQVVFRQEGQVVAKIMLNVYGGKGRGEFFQYQDYDAALGVPLLGFVNGSYGSSLSLKQMKTLFHEMGHAMEGILWALKTPNGSVVHAMSYDDGVEIDAIIMETYAMRPEVLENLRTEGGKKLGREKAQKLNEALHFGENEHMKYLIERTVFTYNLFLSEQLTLERLVELWKESQDLFSSLETLPGLTGLSWSPQIGSYRTRGWSDYLGGIVVSKTVMGLLQQGYRLQDILARWDHRMTAAGY